MPNLYEHWIAQDILTYLKVAKGSRMRGISFALSINPTVILPEILFFEPEVSFESLYQIYEEKQWMCERVEKLEHDLKVLQGMTPFGAVNYIRYGIGYEGYLKEYAQYRKIKPEELLEILDELQDTTRGFDQVDGWLSHIDRYKAEMQRQNQSRGGSRMELPSLHFTASRDWNSIMSIFWI